MKFKSIKSIGDIKKNIDKIKFQIKYKTARKTIIHEKLKADNSAINKMIMSNEYSQLEAQLKLLEYELNILEETNLIM